MTGSNIFSFANARRTSKPLRDHISISDPLSQAELSYMDGRGAFDAAQSSPSVRGLKTVRFPSDKPSLASLNTCDDASQQGETISAKPTRLRKNAARPDRPGGSRSVTQYQNQTKREPSSSTLRSYYDRSKSPLAVSQQTSASSARDFALRKGCPPVVRTPHSDRSCPPTSEAPPKKNSEAPMKRPSRLDFSMLFPKPGPRSAVVLSPQPCTNSSQLLSTTSEWPFKHHQTQSFLHGKKRLALEVPKTLRDTLSTRQPVRKVPPSSGKTMVQKSRPRVQNWFDGVEGAISDDDAGHDDAGREPDMQPDFVEKAFKIPPNKVTQQGTHHQGSDLGNQVWPGLAQDLHACAGPQSSVSAQAEASTGSQPFEAPRDIEASAKRASHGKRANFENRRKTILTPLERADLHEESVLCLSSSDDEDDTLYEGKRCQILEQRGPFLRDSLGVDSIDSDIEIGTAQAVNTSFLRMWEPSIEPNGLLSSTSKQTKSQVQRLKAIEVPQRHSSQQHSQQSSQQVGPQKTSSSSDEVTGRVLAADREDHESLSRTPSVQTVRAAPPHNNVPLIMALTPQEASLLEAMRSKRASMRQHSYMMDIHRIATDEEPRLKPPAFRQLVLGHDFPRPSGDRRPLREEPESYGTNTNCLGNTVLTELAAPAARGSLMFSEGLSSPTTGRDSPDTPVLDLSQDLTVFHGLNEHPSPGSYIAKHNSFGHSRSRTESTRIIVLDNCSRPRKDGMPSEEYPWMLGHLNELANTARIY